jgi:serine/threonine protein kinase
MASPTENWKVVKELFAAALEVEPARRPALLQERCHDENVRAEVERLLAEHDEAGKFLSVPAIGEPTPDEVLAPPKRKIDSYHLLELIGEGGMGEVWLAEQKEPVRRRVALKLIKAGMDTREVVARFESERQALALMDHPAIAKVFETGSTPEGRPYFVMEYVAGTPITTYCDRHKLTTRQRMELFIQVCEGVQHAHQKAIIHRDLKPSNILVSEVDGKPMPRIIDFGLAKATSQRLTDGSIYTRVGAVLGTFEYMSPEQADSGGEDIDTRTDVYSLGVVLYQLLVGALPLDLKKLAYEEILRRLREQDVPRPSSRILTEGGDSAITARDRGTDPPSLTRQLRGDPDAVALKALEKDRKRRYGSPAELAADLGRYLRNEPVTAHPPSAGYRVRKYIRRHRLGVAMAAAAVLLLAGFAVTEWIQLQRITQERDHATRERDRADRITQFMTNMFKVSNPSEALGKTVTARQILDKASKDINNGLSNDPELQAKMMDTMAETYSGLGLYSSAQPLLERATEIQRRVLGPEHPETLQSMNSLANVLYHEGHYAEAEKLCRETLSISRRVLGPENPDTLSTMNNLANDLWSEGHYAEAEKLSRETLDIRRHVLGADNPDTLESMNILAIGLWREGHYADSEKLYREVLDIRRGVLGPDNPDTLNSVENLAGALWKEGHYAEAEKLLRETVDIRRRVQGPEHPATLLSMNNLATDLRSEGHYAEAEKLLREALDIQRRVPGPDHPDTLRSMNNLASTLWSEGHYAEAEKLYRELLDIRRRVLGPKNPDTLLSMNNLASDLRSEGRYAEAEKLLRETIDSRRRVLGPDHPDTAISTYALACVMARQGRRDEALSLLREAVEHGLPGYVVLGMDNDPDLKSLHGDPRFEALVAKARQAAAPTAK